GGPAAAAAGGGTWPGVAAAPVPPASAAKADGASDRASGGARAQVPAQAALLSFADADPVEKFGARDAAAATTDNARVLPTSAAHQAPDMLGVQQPLQGEFKDWERGGQAPGPKRDQGPELELGR